MRYRKMSATGDYTFGQGQLNFYIDSPQAVAQAVETSLKLFLGEWYLNLSEGVPYLQGVVGMHSQAEADAVLKAAIQQVQGVVNVVSYASELNPTTRKYSTISGTINTIYGQTQFQIQNAGNF